MRVTVCQLSDDGDRLERDWQELVAHAIDHRSELVLLPEMPFCPWFARDQRYVPEVWQAAVENHAKWLGRVEELRAEIVLGTRPVNLNGKRLNEGFAWTRDRSYLAVHHKYYLPNEDDFWEASWYQRGEDNFSVHRISGIVIGYLICTEMWFPEHARRYGREGLHILACPRATPGFSADKWLAGGRTAAVISGAYCLSSNRGGRDKHGLQWAGLGWIIEPEEGTVLAVTSEEEPFVTVDIDLSVADRAKQTYPRYVSE